MNTGQTIDFSRLCSWVPGSRAMPAPRNDDVHAFFSSLLSHDDAESEKGGFLRQRRAGMTAIAAAMPVALVLWLAIAYLVPPLAGMDSLGDRMLFTLKCCCVAILFCLVTGIEAVAERRNARPGCAGDGAQHDCPALCGLADRL
jgi:hypothetical protein